MMHKLTPPLLGLVLALTAISSGDVLSKWWAGTGPAVEWRGVEVLTKTVHPGGTLSMVYTAVINRQCPAELRGFVVAEDGTVPIRLPPVSGGYTEVSPDPVRVRVSLTMPAKEDAGLARLQSGDYVYRAVSTRFCPNGVEVDNDVPDVKFYMEVP